MMNELSRSDLVRFLVSAKVKTYASGGSSSQASVDPLLEGSHQLEFRSGEFLYRDIYFGGAFFAGEETVYHGKNAVWCMCYAGGWTNSEMAADEIVVLAGLLQSALRHIPSDYPFRGPLEHREAGYIYTNNPVGDVDRFHGVEAITRDNDLVYELHYCGGRLR
jgi:hypothetical protein